MPKSDQASTSPASSLIRKTPAPLPSSAKLPTVPSLRQHLSQQSSQKLAQGLGQHLRVSDIRGVAQLAVQATSGVATISEGVHSAVLRTVGLALGRTSAAKPDASDKRTRGLTGFIYKSVQGVTQLVGASLDTALAVLSPFLDNTKPGAASSPQREAVLAALNGVLGDQLAANHNPLATQMSLRYQGGALAPSVLLPGNKLLVMIHGLCMNDLQWQPGEQSKNQNIGEALAAAHGYTLLYLRYNSGLHVSTNGQQLAALLEQVLTQFAEPPSITLVAHSMGGLLARSALHYACGGGQAWQKQVNKLVFLGTPHHGAPLERAGNWVDVLLSATPYSAPFAKLGQVRSAGITDLRYGMLLDTDWQDRDRFEPNGDSRSHVPLPENIACYAVAATTAHKRSPIRERLIGDGLVPLRSALGQHSDPTRTLSFPEHHQWTAYGINHMELLHHPQVAAQLLHWLHPSAVV